jgi:hypothetical protein
LQALNDRLIQCVVVGVDLRGGGGTDGRGQRTGDGVREQFLNEGKDVVALGNGILTQDRSSGSSQWATTSTPVREQQHRWGMNLMVDITSTGVEDLWEEVPAWLG